MSYVLKTENLTKKYKKVTVLDQINIHVEKGDIYGLIGSNGAGKTTLMKMVTGIGYQTSGTIELFGDSNLSFQRKRIGAFLDNMEPFPRMTVKENLTVLKKSLGILERDAVNNLMEKTGLTKEAETKANVLSLGKKKKLSIAMALMGNPDFLILDEPMNGLDPQGMIEMRNLFLTLQREEQVTILLSSHILGELGKMATRYGIMKQGRLVEEVSDEELKKRCRQYVDVGVRETERAIPFLEEKGQIGQYEILPEQRIRIYDEECDPAKINRILINENFEVFHLETQRQNLEQYFMERMGKL